jgi:glycosyltransferase involved in cell wall biosynthesis
LHYVSPNEVLANTAVLITTHNRPERLQSLLESLAKYAPWLYIIVASDSRNPEEDLDVVEVVGKSFAERINFLKLPPDSGYGYGRNALVEAAVKKGKMYSIMSDDDYLLPNGDLLPRLAQVLLSVNGDVVAPKRCEFDPERPKAKNCNRGIAAALLRTQDNELYTMSGVSRVYADDRLVNDTSPFVRTSMPARETTGALYDCERSDLVQQFFIARTHVLVGTWDPVLMNNEPYDAMLSLQQRGKRLYACNKLHVDRHSPKNRQTNPRKLMPYVLTKWKLTALWDEDGRRWSIDPATGKITTQTGTEAKSIAETSLAGPDLEHSMQQLMANYNRYQPAWDRVEVVRGQAKERALNPCLTHIVMWLDTIKYPARSISHEGVANKASDCNPCKLKTAGTTKKPMEGSVLRTQHCDVLQQMMTLVWPAKQTGTLGTAASSNKAPLRRRQRKLMLPSLYHPPKLELQPKGRFLYYVVVSSSLSAKIMRGLAKQRAIGAAGSTTLVFVHMGIDAEPGVKKSSWRTDSEKTLEEAGIALEVVVIGPPFGRSLGLRAGFARANDLAKAAGRAEEECNVFALDISMALPPEFSQQIMRSISCGLSAYAPVCLDDSSQYPRWVEGGYGMIGACLRDYNSIARESTGGWRESWWYKWGAEDCDMAVQLQERFIVLRPRLERYRHIAHKTSRAKNPGYYSARNMYPDFLPVVPVSEVEEDTWMKKEVMQFIHSHIPGHKFGEVMWRTPSPPPLAVNFYSVWTSTGELVTVSCRIPKGTHYRYEQPKFRRTHPAHDPRAHSMARWENA